MNRRDFVKTVAISGVAIAASDTIADLLAQSPKGRVLDSKFKGLSDIALTEAKKVGCTYADGWILGRERTCLLHTAASRSGTGPA